MEFASKSLLCFYKKRKLPRAQAWIIESHIEWSLRFPRISIWIVHEARILPHSLAGLSFNFIRLPDKSPARSVSFDLSASFLLIFYFVFVTLYQMARTLSGVWWCVEVGHEMQIYTNIVDRFITLKEKKKNALFIYNSMQFHTFFLVAQYRLRSMPHFWYWLLSLSLSRAPTKSFVHSLSLTTPDNCTYSCVFTWSRFECNFFHNSAAIAPASFNWSQIIIHSHGICMRFLFFLFQCNLCARNTVVLMLRPFLFTISSLALSVFLSLHLMHCSISLNFLASSAQNHQKLPNLAAK